MSEKYPLYPELSEKGKEEAQLLINSFKEQLMKVAEETIGSLYVDAPSYIEGDSWGNFRNEIMSGFQNYNNRKLQNSYDFKKIRAEIYKEFREDIIKDLDKDIFEENQQLKKQIEHLSNLLEIANKRY